MFSHEEIHLIYIYIYIYIERERERESCTRPEYNTHQDLLTWQGRRAVPELIKQSSKKLNLKLPPNTWL